MERRKSIIIEGVEYTPTDELKPAKEVNGLKYVIVRTYSAGVFADRGICPADKLGGAAQL